MVRLEYLQCQEARLKLCHLHLPNANCILGSCVRDSAALDGLARKLQRTYLRISHWSGTIPTRAL